MDLKDKFLSAKYQIERNYWYLLRKFKILDLIRNTRFLKFKLLGKKAVKLNGYRYSIRRESDGMGESGPMLHSLNPKKIKTYGDINSHKGVVAIGTIVEGCSICCGVYYARTFGNDWWLTTPVSKILEVNEDRTYVKFKTSAPNYSIYEARAF